MERFSVINLKPSSLIFHGQCFHPACPCRLAAPANYGVTMSAYYRTGVALAAILTSCDWPGPSNLQAPINYYHVLVEHANRERVE